MLSKSIRSTVLALQAIIGRLNAKFQAKADTHPGSYYDVERPLTTSDLTTNDLSAGIAVDVPKKWINKFMKTVTFRRVKD